RKWSLRVKRPPAAGAGRAWADVRHGPGSPMAFKRSVAKIRLGMRAGGAWPPARHQYVRTTGPVPVGSPQHDRLGRKLARSTSNLLTRMWRISGRRAHLLHRQGQAKD